MRKAISAVLVSIMLVSMFSGCGVLKKLGFGNGKNDEAYPVSSIAISEDEAKKLTSRVQVHLYFADEKKQKLKKEIRYIQASEAKKSANSLAAAIVNELIKGPGKNTGLAATIPDGTKLRSPITIKAGVATVDLTSEFRDNHKGGKELEQLTIYSIVNSLTELKEIQKVKFMINGKDEEKYKGNFKFDAPFPRDLGLVSMDTSVTSSLDEDAETVNAAGDGSAAEDKDGTGVFNEGSGESDEELLE